MKGGGVLERMRNKVTEFESFNRVMMPMSMNLRWFSSYPGIRQRWTGFGPWVKMGVTHLDIVEVKICYRML